MIRLARLIVRLSAWIAPAEWRARWREEWLGEIERAAAGGRAPLRLVVRAGGAPVDALAWRVREWRDISLVTGWRTDLRDAARALRRTPWQTLTIFLCLTVGTTLTLLVFGIVNAMTIGEQPGIRDRGSLVHLLVEGVGTGRPARDFVMGDVLALGIDEDMPGLAAWGVQYEGRSTSIDVGSQSVRVRPTFVGGDYFRALGTQPALGRLIASSDDRPDATPVVVLGHRFWTRHFSADPDVLDTVVRVGSRQCLVIGVAPPEFGGWREVRPGDTMEGVGDIWLPLVHARQGLDELTFLAYSAIGPKAVARLAPGVSILEAEALLKPAGERISAARAAENLKVAERRGRTVDSPTTLNRIRLQGFHYFGAHDADERLLSLALLSIAPLMVLLISCANAAGVQLSRAVARTSELAIRVSLGGGRGRVVRLLALETGIVAIGAGLAAWAIVTQVLRFGRLVLPLVVVADRWVFLFSLLLPVGVMWLSGVLPARRAMGFDVMNGLRHGTRTGGAVGNRFRSVLVGAQVALSVAILATTAYLIQSIGLLPEIKGRFDEDLLTVELRMDDLRESPEGISRITRELVAGIQRLPGVRSVGVGEPLLSQTITSLNEDGLPAFGRATPRLVSASLFTTLGLEILRGRGLADGDGPGVVVVNETFLLDHPDPASVVGSTLPMDGGGTAQVVGVVENGHERAARGTAFPVLYGIRTEDSPYVTIFARAESAGRLIPGVQRLMAEVDPRLAPFEIGTAADLMRREYAPMIGAAWGIGTVGLLAILLAAVGLFGSVSQSTAQRTHEFGVRLALGARPVDVARLVTREALSTCVAGLLLGLLISVPLLVLLIETFTRDVLSLKALALVVGLLATAVFGATYFPTRRAMRTDPMISLRAE